MPHLAPTSGDVTWTLERRQVLNCMAQNDEFYILALDGGGTRGVYSAQVLACVEELYGAPLREQFDLVAGTSTGSIIAGAAAAGIPMAKVVELFEKESPRIFKRRRLGSFHIRSKYSRQSLEQVVRSYVSDLTLGEISTPLMIMSSDISAGGVHVFKSRYLKNLGHPYVRDANVALSDAILASCAAPTYFDPMPVGDFRLADGGLWANNPSIIALTEAVAKFGRSVEQLRILSIGTGHSVNLYSESRLWGLITGWGREKLVSYVLRLQSDASANMAQLLLTDRYLRMDPQIEAWDLDDIEHLGNLKALATRDFALHSDEIAKHLRRSE